MSAQDTLRPLLDAAREGDDHALAELVRRTQAPVRRLCTVLGSAGETDDLVQETYLRALRALPAFRGEAPVLLWLLSLARRACADDVRRRERGRLLARRIVHERPETESRPPGDPVDDMLRSLPLERREAFALTQLLGLSYDEAAVALGCPIGTVRSRVARARLDLVAALQRSQVL